ncbi:MAG: translocation/assembly module TamB domain-containing protein [Calditrichaeota bacterium]|nr:translocation/assembly module TamB domain-containing protein [Calditrichota bacterium]
MKKLPKILSYLVLGVIVLILLLLAFTQTGMFRDWLREQAVIASHHYLNGEVTVAKLSGNLFRRIELEDVTVTLDDVTVLQVERILFRLNPVALLTRKIHVSTVLLEKPELALSQDEKLRWNVGKLLKALDPDDAAASDGAAPEFGWDVELPDIRIESGAVTIAAANGGHSGLPAAVRDFDFDLGVWLRNGKVAAALRNLSFRTQNPDLLVRTVQSEFNYDTDDFQARGFRLHTAASTITGEVAVRDLDDPVVDLVLSGKPISLDELRRAVPEINIFGNAQLDLEVSGPLDSLAVKCALRLGDGEVTVAGLLNVEAEQLAYDLTGAVSGFDLAMLFNDDAYATDLNLQLQAAGQGIDIEEMDTAFTVQLDSSLVLGQYIGFVVLDGKMQNDSLQFQLETAMYPATANLAGWLALGSDLVHYSVTGEIRDFDFSEFDSARGLKSDLDVFFSLQGSGLELEMLSGKLRADVSDSFLNGVPIDTVAVQLVFSRQRLDIQQFEVVSSLGRLTADGVVSFEDETDLTVTADLSDLSVLTGTIVVDTLTGRGKFKGVIHGPPDSLMIAVALDLQNLGSPDLTAAAFRASADGFVAKTGTRFDVSAAVQNLTAFGTQVDTISFNVLYTDTVSQFELGLALRNGATARTEGAFRIAGDTYLVDFRDLELELSQHRWQKIGVPWRLSIRDTRYDFPELILESEGQRFVVSGRFDTEGENEVRVKFADIDLSKYNYQPELELGGILQVDFFLDGTLSKPKLGGRMELDRGKYSEFSFDAFRGRFGYSENKFSWRCSLARTAADSLLESSGLLPIRLSLSPSEADFLPDKPLEFKISSRGLDLAFLDAFVDGVQDINGLLVADVVLSNTWNELEGVGPIRLINAEFRIPEIGIKYEKINLVLLLNGRDLVIRDFGMRSGDGYMRLLEGGLSLAGDTVEKFKARFKVKNFELIDNKSMAARASGTVEVFGSLQSPYISGDLTVDQLRVSYQEFEEETAVTLSSTPFFVLTDDSAAVDTTGALRFQKVKKVEEVLLTETEFYKNLNGELSIYFPRNAWIRGPNTSIEIEGDVVLVKENGPDFALFGSLSTRRGFYHLFGNRFQIQKGEMVFNGEAEINPVLNIEAATIITEDRGEDKPEKHEFKVVITGSLYFPEFRFLLDEQEASQQDVFSILLFGQPYDKLSHGEKSAGSEVNLEDRATGVVTSQLLRQISSRLGDEFSLDVVEINSDKGDLSESTVRVGKYVTPDVFVSVSQDFGAEGNQIVEFEYEIPRKILFFNLLLQATSDRQGDTGLDVIWKIEW